MKYHSIKPLYLKVLVKMEAIRINDMLRKYMDPDVLNLIVQYLYYETRIVPKLAFTCKSCNDAPYSGDADILYENNLYCKKCDCHLCESCCEVDIGYTRGAECLYCGTLLI